MKERANLSSAIILVIGDELVAGDVSDQNASWLAKALIGIGFDVYAIAIIKDDPKQVVRCLRSAVRLASHVFVTGGLSSTPDDITRQAAAAAFGVPLVRSRKVANEIRRSGRWKKHDFALQTAYFPRGARAIASPLGGVSGFVIRNAYVLPGAPAEVRAMFYSLRLKAAPFPILKRTLMYSVTEDVILDTLRAFASEFPGVKLGSYPLSNGPHPRLSLVLRGRSRTELNTAARWLQAHIA